MKITGLVLASALALTAVSAAAMTVVEDADGNGTYSMDEMIVSFPDLTDADFAEIDADASGEVSQEELVAAVESGLLPE